MGVGLDAQVEEKLQDVDIFRKILPRSAGGEGGSRSRISRLPLGEAGVQRVLVDMGVLEGVRRGRERGVWVRLGGRGRKMRVRRGSLRRGVRDNMRRRLWVRMRR